MAERLGRTHAGLPDDIVNFQHDALACAVALGWDGVEVSEVPLTFILEGGDVQELVDQAGVPTHVVTSVDGERFQRDWLSMVVGR